tara:strand:+ start:237 stop:533 length:297 start_codon:yes stop_codon:yes gene_type:complete
MANLYCTATNTGKGFFTHQDRVDFYLHGCPGDVWIVGDNSKGSAWIDRVSGTIKTKAEAQTIVDDIIEEGQAGWDALPIETFGKRCGALIRPIRIILP